MVKSCISVMAVISILAASGCGVGEDTSTTVSSKSQAAGATTTAEHKPRYPVPQVPPVKGPLKKLVVKDLKVGKGPVARWGDEATVRYVGVYSKTGKVFTQHWNVTYSFDLDGEEIGPGWQKGIHGMRVGGRRELLIPGALLFGGGTDAAYVVTLDKVKPGAAD